MLMSDDKRYLVPDYYPHFSCKMGACRSACCVGWPISVTMEDYFRLLGITCSAELRRRLDVAMHLCEHPTLEEYAQITPRFDGQCPLRLADGRCAVHAELGEDVLSAVCRLYPRGVRTEDGPECSCANSCEAVLELLLHHPEPLSFHMAPLSIREPETPRRSCFFETMGRAQEIRLWLIAQVQDRRYPLPRRLLALGEALRAMDEALSARNSQRVDRLLRGAEALPIPPAAQAGEEQLRFGLRVAGRMLEMIDRSSRSVHDYGEAALAYFGSDGEAFRRYGVAREHFERLLPQWETWFEHMLVNHMFFIQFPFQDRPVSLREEFLALCAVYALLRFLCLGWTAQHDAADDAVDVAAAAFRLIDHTEFDRYAVPLLRDVDCTDAGHLSQLLCL